MQVFEYSFTVDAPVEAVAEFHRDTRALKRLTPPPVWVQLQHVDPLAEGSVSEFTLWFGPLPVRWQALHSSVDRLRGFTDTQARGPMRQWRHRHRFTPLADGTTRVEEHVEYEHDGGLRGLLSRVLFARPALQLMFAYRSFVTRRALRAR